MNQSATLPASAEMLQALLAGLSQQQQPQQQPQQQQQQQQQQPASEATLLKQIQQLQQLQKLQQLQLIQDALNANGTQPVVTAPPSLVQSQRRATAPQSQNSLLGIDSSLLQWNSGATNVIDSMPLEFASVLKTPADAAHQMQLALRTLADNGDGLSPPSSSSLSPPPPQPPQSASSLNGLFATSVPSNMSGAGGSISLDSLSPDSLSGMEIFDASFLNELASASPSSTTGGLLPSGLGLDPAPVSPANSVRGLTGWSSAATTAASPLDASPTTVPLSFSAMMPSTATTTSASAATAAAKSKSKSKAASLSDPVLNATASSTIDIKESASTLALNAARDVPATLVTGPTVDNSTASAAPAGRGRQSAKTKQQAAEGRKKAHNAIERRYRNNINDRIKDLRNAVPALCYPVPPSAEPLLPHEVKKGRKRRAGEVDEEDDGDDYMEGPLTGNEIIVDGIVATSRNNKAIVLRKGTEYIYYLRKSVERLRRESAAFKAALESFPGGQEFVSTILSEIGKLKSEIPDCPFVEGYADPNSLGGAPSIIDPLSLQAAPMDPPSPAASSTSSRDDVEVHRIKRERLSSASDFADILSPASLGVFSDSGGEFSPTRSTASPSGGGVAPRLLLAVFMGISFFGVPFSSTSSGDGAATAAAAGYPHSHSAHQAAHVMDDSVYSSSFISASSVANLQWSSFLPTIVFTLCLLMYLYLDGVFARIFGFANAIKASCTGTEKTRRALQVNDQALKDRYSSLRDTAQAVHGHYVPAHPLASFATALWSMARYSFRNILAFKSKKIVESASSDSSDVGSSNTTSTSASNGSADSAADENASGNGAVNVRAEVLLQMCELELLEPPTLRSIGHRAHTLASLYIISRDPSLRTPLLQRIRMAAALHVHYVLTHAKFAVAVPPETTRALVTTILGRSLSGISASSPTPSPENRALVQLASQLRADPARVAYYDGVIANQSLQRRIGRHGEPVAACADVAGLHSLANALRSFISDKMPEAVPEIAAAGSLTHGSPNPLIRWCGFAAASLLAHCRVFSSSGSSSDASVSSGKNASAWNAPVSQRRSELAAATMMILAKSPLVANDPRCVYISLVIAAVATAVSGELEQANAIYERAEASRMKNASGSSGTTMLALAAAGQQDLSTIDSIIKCLEFMAANTAMATRWYIWRSVREAEVAAEIAAAVAANALSVGDDDEDTETVSTVVDSDVECEPVSSKPATGKAVPSASNADPEIEIKSALLASMNSRQLRASLLQQLSALRRMSPADVGVKDGATVRTYGAMYQKYMQAIVATAC
ncbi:hypothetical protein GQ42DRAFT_164303 [Ramicandelaber brevisporus]|nr:hypothetical protein GQ42DRAFT_164303 [Ramicandelaber brevisporus]